MQLWLDFQPCLNIVCIFEKNTHSPPFHFFALGSNMSKARRKKTPVIPPSCSFEVPTFYQQTLSSKRLLLMDFFVKRGKERVLVFSSNQQLELLFNSDIIFMDGTFSTTPENFDQVFLIHVQLHNQGEEIILYLIIALSFSPKGMPVAFCLLPNRRATTYIDVLQRFKAEAIKINKVFEPKRVISDFESSFIAAVRQEVDLCALLY
jgi:hypothetical protein